MKKVEAPTEFKDFFNVILKVGDRVLCAHGGFYHKKGELSVGTIIKFTPKNVRIEPVIQTDRHHLNDSYIKKSEQLVKIDNAQATFYVLQNS